MSMLIRPVTAGTSLDSSDSDTLSHSAAAVSSLDMLTHSTREPPTAHLSNITPTPQPDLHDTATLAAAVTFPPPIALPSMIDDVNVPVEQARQHSEISTRAPARTLRHQESEGVPAPPSSSLNSLSAASAFGALTVDAIAASQSSSSSTPPTSVLEPSPVVATAAAVTNAVCHSIPTRTGQLS